MNRAVALAVVLASATVGAQPAPAVDVADLPPLPPADEEQSTSATVLAAASAEEDTVVGAAKREQSLGNVASAVTVISADRIRRFGYRTVGEAVAGVAGTYLQDTRIVSTVGIRGLNILGDFNTRILVLVDGATVNESWGSFAGVGFGTLVSIDEISRIEVIRGPVSSVYGTNAFFGIINIVTRGAAESPKAWGRVGINSVNGLTSAAGFAHGDVHKQIRGTAFVMNRIGDATTIPEISPTPLEGDGALSFGAALAGTYDGWFGQVRAFRFRRDSPWAPYDGDPAAATPYSEYNTQLLAEVGRTQEVSDRLTVVGRAYTNLYRFYDHIIQFEAPPFDDYGDARTFGGELRGRYQIIEDKLGVTAGTEASYAITKSRAFEEGDPGVTVPQNFRIAGVYTELDGQPTNWLGFTAGVRYDNNSVIDSRVSPRAALFLSKPEKYGLKLLYAQGFRNPSAYEAFFFDNTSFAKPPADLRSEVISSYEAVVWAKPLPGLSTRVSAFHWDVERIVEQVPFDDPVLGSLLQFQNIGRYISQGVEVEASYRNSKGWYAFGGGAYSRVGRSADPDMPVVYGNVPNAPALTAAGGISTPKLGDVGHVSVDATFIGKRLTRPDEMGNALPASPAWTGVNATLYIPNVKGFDITAGLRNIIGTRDFMPAPGDYDRTVPDPVTVARIPGEGREVYVKVGYSY